MASTRSMLPGAGVERCGEALGNPARAEDAPPEDLNTTVTVAVSLPPAVSVRAYMAQPVTVTAVMPTRIALPVCGNNSCVSRSAALLS